MAALRSLLVDEKADARAKEQLRFLMASAQGKLKSYKQDLENMFLNPEAVGKIQIIGKRAFKYYEEYRANVSEGVGPQIKEMVNNFFKGTKDGVKEGFQNLVHAGLSTILGERAAGEKETQLFFIVPENNAFIRVDVKCWRYNFSSTGVISNCENAFCFVFCKSIIDHTTLTVDEMVYLLSEMVDGDLKKVQPLIEELSAVWEAVQKKTLRSVANSYFAEESKMLKSASIAQYLEEIED
jgi:hypothetical protein